jgi:predicted transcriptional regulator of viral defense system
MKFNSCSLTPLEAEILLGMIENNLDRIDVMTTRRWIGKETKPTSRLLDSLQGKGWLERLGQDLYALIAPLRSSESPGRRNPLALAWTSARPAYIGWGSAAAFHGYETRSPTQIAVATTRPRRRRVICGQEVRYVAVSPQRFFGFTSEIYCGSPLEISNREKTVTDCVDRPSLCGGYAELCGIISRAAPELDWKLLLAYVRRFRSISLVQRLGFFLELVEADVPEALLESLEDMVEPTHRSTLASIDTPMQPDVIGFVRRWDLFVPFARAALISTVPTVKKDIEKAAIVKPKSEAQRPGSPVEESGPYE